MEIVKFLDSVTLLSLVKFLLVVLLAVYNVFAYLMMTQVATMTRAIRVKDDYVIKTLTIAHLSLSILVLLIAIIVL